MGKKQTGSVQLKTVKAEIKADEKVLRQVLSELHPKIQKCHSALLKYNKNLKGMVEFSIQPTESDLSFSFKDASKRRKMLNLCITRRIQEIEKISLEGSIQVVYELVLEI